MATSEMMQAGNRDARITGLQISKKRIEAMLFLTCWGNNSCLYSDT